MCIIFGLLDPDQDSEYGSGSGSTDLIESGSNLDPDPKPWSKVSWPWLLNPGLVSRKTNIYAMSKFMYTYGTRYPINCTDNTRFDVRSGSDQAKKKVRVRPDPDQGEGTQPLSLLSPPGPGSVRLCNAMETELPNSHPFPTLLAT
jgi:hypothetical protein